MDSSAAVVDEAAATKDDASEAVVDKATAAVSFEGVMVADGEAAVTAKVCEAAAIAEEAADLR